LLSEAVRVAGCAWLPDGGRAGWLWAGWVARLLAWLWLLCVDVDMVGGVSRGGCLVGGCCPRLRLLGLWKAGREGAWL
jgi:hypothetical protein